MARGRRLDEMKLPQSETSNGQRAVYQERGWNVGGSFKVYPWRGLNGRCLCTKSRGRVS